MANTIKLKKYSDVVEEIKATAVAITPGMLLELTTAGLVQAHSASAGDVCPPMFALEDELQGKGIDDAYAVSVPIQVWIPYRGDQVYAFLVAGGNVAISAKLESDGAGALKAYTAQAVDEGGAATYNVYDRRVVAHALEAVDNSGGGTPVRIKVRVV